jgi:hypothetical protein
LLGRLSQSLPYAVDYPSSNSQAGQGHGFKPGRLEGLAGKLLG